MRTVLLLTGAIIRTMVYQYTGGAMIGDPTAYIKINGNMVWVLPGQNTDFVEATTI